MMPKDIKQRDAVLTFLKTRANRPVSSREIASKLGVRKNELRALKRILNSLVRSGDIYRTRSQLYGIAEKMSLITGFFEAHRDGYGFVLPDKTGEKDLFVPPRKTSGAMTGDRVIARVESPVRREGRVIKIIERGKKKVVGKLSYDENLYYVRPRGKKTPFDIYIPSKKKGKAKAGDTVVVELTSYPSTARPPEGRVVKIMHVVDSPVHEIDLVIEDNDLPRKFPSVVLKEAGSCQDRITAKGRIDCRRLLTVTIDGETAQDFDDAISIEKNAEGYTLWVHIADVSHYVPWDSALDLEARRRGTSVYFPGRVIPMLPENLSNNLCSLVPKTDRLTFTVEMKFDAKGRLREKDFYPSIINSNERMTYTSVKKILVDHDAAERRKYRYLLKDVELMEELFRILRKVSVKRGSLDFDLPEPEVLLDIQGRPEAILRAERDVSHMIIEAFMIAANEAVASHLENLGIPTLYRVHEKPDAEKIESLTKIFRALGLREKKTGRKAFQKIIQEAEGTPGERLVSLLLLRSLKQAKYSTENIGHFGLASGSYTHFTSPIRRYPDLVAHRILKDVLKGKKITDKKRNHLEGVLPEIAFNSSRTERVADQAERDVVNAMKVWFMKDKVGDEYEGVITDITPYGLKVQLRDFFVEGFLRVSSMPDDYYQFDERRYSLVGRHTKRMFTLGKSILIRIDRVDVEERQVFFARV
jgi:ribonuclease R